MKALIKITDQDNKQVVNARELHQFLEVDTRFNDWIERRIQEYQFIENEDYVFLLKNEYKSKKGRPSKEYAISLGMAKELSMVERNEKGKQARRYFIECEKQIRNNVFSSAPKLLTVSTKPIAEKRKEYQNDLMEIIKLNLNKGDLKKIEKQENISYNRIRNVISAKTFDYDIIYILYEKARNNLMFLDTEIKALKEDLQSLSA